MRVREDSGDTKEGPYRSFQFSEVSHFPALSIMRDLAESA